MHSCASRRVRVLRRRWCALSRGPLLCTFNVPCTIQFVSPFPESYTGSVRYLAWAASLNNHRTVGSVYLFFVKQPLFSLETTGPSGIFFSKPQDKDVVQNVDEVKIT